MKRKEFLTGLATSLAIPFTGLPILKETKNKRDKCKVELKPEPDTLIVTGNLVGLHYSYNPATSTLEIKGDLSRLPEADLSITNLCNRNISDLNIIFT